METILNRFEELVAENSNMETILNRFEELVAENSKLKTELQEAKDYADKLVEHKDMACLPADLANLREANAHFAMENHELQEKVDKLKKELKHISNDEFCNDQQYW